MGMGWEENDFLFKLMINHKINKYIYIYIWPKKMRVGKKKKKPSIMVLTTLLVFSIKSSEIQKIYIYILYILYKKKGFLKFGKQRI
jgi:hypothetical protein